MGTASDQMSLRVQANNRLMLTSLAALSLQAINMSNLFERMARGQVSAGEAVALFGADALQTTSYLLALNMAQEKRVALQGASVLAAGREALAAAASTAASWLKVAALKAESIALGVRSALSGPVGWAVLAGAAAAAGAGYALASRIPQAANGAVFDRPTLALLGEGGESEIAAPESKLRQIFSESQTTYNNSNPSISVHVYGASSYEEARRGARDGIVEGLQQMDHLQRKGAM
jgi:hypothetical protein